MSRWLQRARQRALSPGFRQFIVVRNSDDSEIFQMARIFATGQGLAGSPEPPVLPSLDEPLRLLGAKDPAFELVV
jgi:hypothetical protein